MNKRLRICVIGAGKIAPDHLQCLNKIANVEIAGLANRSGNHLEILCKRFGIAHAYTDWRRMVDEQKPDAVWVLTNIESLAGIAEELISRKIPCFLEKPVALQSETVKKLAVMAEQGGVPVMVGFNRRFAQPVLKSWMLCQGMNSPLSVQAEINEDLRQVYEKQRHSKAVLDAWMVANSIHVIDLVNYFAPDMEIENVLWSRAQELPEASFNAQLRSPQTLGSIHGDWVSLRLSNISLRLEDMAIDIQGVDQAFVRAKGARDVRFVQDGVDKKFKVGFMRQTGYFIDCLVEGRPVERPACSLWDCYTSVLLAEKIQHSRSRFL